MIRWNVLFSIVSVASTFAFLSVFWWSLQRRREREAYYRYELARQLIERSGSPQESVLEWVRESEAAEQRRRRDGILIGGLVSLAAGIGAVIPVGTIRDDEAIPGMICTSVGVALLVYLAITWRKRK